MPPVQYYEALKQIADRKAVIIAGPPHIGKTATALHLAHSIRQEQGLNAIVRLNPHDNLRPWFNSKNLAIILDDCFGEVALTQEALANNFAQFTHNLSQNNFVICTSRSQILHQAQQSTRLGESRFLIDQVIELDQEGSYDGDALLRVLERHLNWCQSNDPWITKEQAELALQMSNAYRRLRTNVFPALSRIVSPYNDHSSTLLFITAKQSSVGQLLVMSTADNSPPFIIEILENELNAKTRVDELFNIAEQNDYPIKSELIHASEIAFRSPHTHALVLMKEEVHRAIEHERLHECPQVIRAHLQILLVSRNESLWRGNSSSRPIFALHFRISRRT